MSNWIERTMENMDAVIDASKKLKEGKLTELEKQSAKATASMHRCRRCGDITVGIMPEFALQRICSECEKELKLLDGQALWFATMVGRVNSGEDNNA